MTVRTPQIIALFGFGCAFIGSFLPWIKIGVFSKAGTDGDGMVTLVAAAIGALVLLFGGSGGRMLAVLAAIVVIGVIIVDLVDLSDRVEQFNRTQSLIRMEASSAIGSGMLLTILGGGVALLASLAGGEPAGGAYEGDGAQGRRSQQHGAPGVTATCSECGSQLDDVNARYCPSCGVNFALPPKRIS